MNFPKLDFDNEHVPIGDSVRMCIGFSWNLYKKRSQYDKYLDVQGFDDCAQAVSGRSTWLPDYPKKGLNMNLWSQHVARDDPSCSGGIYVPTNKLCYRYHAMK